jgi:hypothetical protein
MGGLTRIANLLSHEQGGAVTSHEAETTAETKHFLFFVIIDLSLRSKGL